MNVRTRVYEKRYERIKLNSYMCLLAKNNKHRSFGFNYTCYDSSVEYG